MPVEKKKYSRVSGEDEYLVSNEMKSTYPDDYESGKTSLSEKSNKCLKTISNNQKIFIACLIVLTVVVGLAVAVVFNREGAGIYLF